MNTCKNRGFLALRLIVGLMPAGSSTRKSTRRVTDTASTISRNQKQHKQHSIPKGKTMANHNEVAHAWANQTGRARRGFNMYYEGHTIFSYGDHFPIARIVDEAGSSGAPGLILFTSRSYSTSTAKHKTYTSRAIDHHRYTVLVVHNVRPIGPNDHRDNYERLIRAAKDALGKAARARKYASFHLDDAERFIRTANEYSARFGLGVPEVTKETLDEAAAAIAKRAEEMRAAAELERARAARARALRERDDLRAWLRGADVYPPHTRVPYVRVKGDEVETTWGAKVPLADAMIAWAAMKEARAEHITLGRCEDGSSLRVGDFTVSQITPTGMRVGCHFIPFKFAQLAACAAGIA